MAEESPPGSAPAADPIDALLVAATEHHRAARLHEARRLYGEVLAQRPAHALALFRSGLLELQEGRAQAALEALAAAAAAAPDEARYHFGCGQALAALGRWREAAAYQERAVALAADLTDAWIALGIAHQRSGQVARSVPAYRRALALAPREPSALGNLGAALVDLSQIDEAVTLLEAAREIEPSVDAHAVNLALALNRRGDFAGAAATLEGLVGRAPESPGAAFNLAQALRGLGRVEEAARWFARAIALRPDHVEAWTNLGNLERERGELARAREAYEAALRVRPDDLIALNNLAALLRSLGRLDEAEALARRGLALDPCHAVLHDTLGNVLKDAGALDEALACFRRALELDPERAVTHSNLAYSRSFSEPQPEPLLEECRRYQARFAARVERDDTWRVEPASERRLRLGYVSPDFREHCQSLFTLPLLAQHDHAAFEVFCYASVTRPDSITRRIAGHADAWRDVQPLDDAALAARVRADGIDILVDLTMHMAGGRPLLFARKPAPVQIAWLAYPGTTGLEAMDYRLSDPRLDPPGEDRHYSERTLRLPDSFWCYDPLAPTPEVGPLPALARGYVTFGCLNNPCKLTERTFELWAPVLRSLPDARLRLLAPRGRHRAELARRLEAHGIEVGRVDFSDFRPRAEYLASYGDIDLGLDTLPYNGHTTSLDALWMGVPTVTRVGGTVVGRGGLSQLHQLDLDALAARSDEEYLETALTWAADLGRLAQLRAELRTRLARSPLMDASRFARAIEALYREAWRAYCARVRPS